MEEEVSCAAAQDYTPAPPVATANASTTADLSSSPGQPLNQSVPNETGSLVYNSQYTPPIISSTVPLSHPDFNQMTASQPSFNPAAASTSAALQSSSSFSATLSSSINGYPPGTPQHEGEGSNINGLPVTYTETSYSHPPALISLTPTSPGPDRRSFSNMPSCAFHMTGQMDSTGKGAPSLYSNPQHVSVQQGNKATGTNSPTQRRIPVKIINLSKKKDVGVQCEVGHETLQALFEEERKAVRSSHRRSATSSINSERMLAEDSASGAVFDPSDSVSKFPCEYEGCIRAYVHRKDLVRHMKVAHKISPKVLEPKVVESPAKPNLCQVGNCGKSYFHLKDLRRHQRQCHSVTVAAVAPGSDEFWESGGSLRYPCDFSGCTKSYIHKKDLIRHKRMFHSDSSSRPSIPDPVIVVTAKKKENGVSECSGSTVSSPEHATTRKRFRLDSSAEPQCSPNLPISSMQPGHSLEADLAALSASNIMDNLSVVAGIVGANQLPLPPSLFPIPSSLSGTTTPVSSVLTTDGDVQQLMNTLPSAFSCASAVNGDASAATVEDIASTSAYQSTQLLTSISFPTSTTMTQYSSAQGPFSSDSGVHAASDPCSGILSHVS